MAEKKLRDQVSLYPIRDRENKVKENDLASVVKPGSGLSTFVDSLPNILKAEELQRFVGLLGNAVTSQKLVSIGMGAHVIKTGISPLIIDAMKKGWVKHLAMNGAGPIHDFELAYQGETSEDVARGLEDGTFGMIAETGEFIHSALAKYHESGYGAAIGRAIEEADLLFKRHSLLANAYNLNVPVTVHVGVGTDIVFQHPAANGAHVGTASMKDFDIFANLLPGLHEGGVFMNFGSAVIVPEVFLKALTVARNVTQTPYKFFTGNFDMTLHYRPNFNVLSRPVDKGCGFHFTGHHELMLPLLFALLSEKVMASGA